jgi:CheY-like chemotaxis protein
MNPPLVLIVEDDAATRELYAAALTQAGLRTSTACNGSQALERVVQFNPDVVLTDGVMPGMDGIEFIQRMKRSGATRLIPILVVTGHRERKYFKSLKAAGADRVLTKPCLDESLVAAVLDLIRTRALARKRAGEDLLNAEARLPFGEPDDGALAKL